MNKILEDIIKMDIFVCKSLLHRNKGEQYENEIPEMLNNRIHKNV